MVSIKCKKCGKEIDSEYKICPFCGEPLISEKPVDEETVKVETNVDDSVKAKKSKKIPIIIASSIVLLAALIIGGVVLYKNVIKPAKDYTAAEMLMDEGKYVEAQKIYQKLGNYKDSSELYIECDYQQAIALYEKKDYKAAVEFFSNHYDYSESKKYVYNIFLEVAGQPYIDKFKSAIESLASYYESEKESIIEFVKDVQDGVKKKGTWSRDYENKDRKNMLDDKENLVDMRTKVGSIFNPAILDSCGDEMLSDAYDAFVDLNSLACEMCSNHQEYIDDLTEGSTDKIVSDLDSIGDKFDVYLEMLDKLGDVTGSDKKYIDENKASESETTSNDDKSEKSEKETTEKEKSETTTESTTESTKEESYYENDTFEVVYKTLYNDILGYSTIVHKVHASKSKHIEATVIAYDLDGNVIGKSTDEVELTEGEYSALCYRFTNDVSNATFEVKVKIDEPSFMIGDRDAVELVTYNSDDYHLYLTFKQVSKNLGEFSRFRLLYIRDGEVVGDDEGYFSVYAENLNGVDTTDVAKILGCTESYDYIEYFFEP